MSEYEVPNIIADLRTVGIQMPDKSGFQMVCLSDPSSNNEECKFDLKKFFFNVSNSFDEMIRRAFSNTDTLVQFSNVPGFGSSGFWNPIIQWGSEYRTSKSL